MKKKIIVIVIILAIIISTILIMNQTQYKEVIETSIDTFYLTNNGNVYVKGENVDGELGLGHTNPVEKPTKVTTLKNIEKIIVQTVGAMEDRDIYFISKNGEVYVSGLNDVGQLGLGHNNNVTVATKITALEGIKIKNVIEANNSDGKSSKYYLAENGDVYVSGENDLGQLGLGHTNNVNIAAKIPTLKDIKDIVTSGESTYYLTNEGKVYVSGANEVGQLGLGHKENMTQPTLVKDLENIVVEKIEVELFYDYTENPYTKNANVYYTINSNEIYKIGSSYGSVLADLDNF